MESERGGWIQEDLIWFECEINMSLLEKKLFDFDNFFIFLSIVSYKCIISLSVTPSWILKSCLPLLSLLLFLWDLSILVLFFIFRSLEPGLDDFLTFLYVLAWLLLHGLLTILNFASIHLGNEICWSHNAIENVRDQIRDKFIRWEVSNVHVHDMLHATNKDLTLEELLSLCHIFILDLISNVAEITDVDSVLMEELAQGTWVSWNILSFLKVGDQILNSCFLQILSKPHNFLLLSLNLLFTHSELDLFENIGIVYVPLDILDEILEIFLSLLIKLHNQLLILFLLFFRVLFSLFNLRLPWIFLLLKQFVCFNHHFLSVIKGFISHESIDQLLSNQASVILIAQIVRVTRCHSLQINNVTPLVSTPNTFDLHTSRNFNRFALSIKNFVHLYTQFPRNLFHQCVELLIWLNCFLLVHRSVLCQTRKLRVVQDTRDNTLGNDSVTPIINDCSGNVMKSINFKLLQLPKTWQVMISLCPGWILIRWRQILERIVRIDGEREENEVVHEDLLLLLFSWIQGRNTALNDCNSAFSCCVQEIVVNFWNCSISLSALGHIFFWEVLDYLILLIPVTNTFGIKAEERVDNLAKSSLGTYFVGFPIILLSPVVELERRLRKEILFRVQNLIDVDLQIFGEQRR